MDPGISDAKKHSRQLAKRIMEYRTQISAIYEHRLSCQYRCDSDNFKILDTATDEFSLRIKKEIYLNKKKQFSASN